MLAGTRRPAQRSKPGRAVAHAETGRTGVGEIAPSWVVVKRFDALLSTYQKSAAVRKK